MIVEARRVISVQEQAIIHCNQLKPTKKKAKRKTNTTEDPANPLEMLFNKANSISDRISVEDYFGPQKRLETAMISRKHRNQGQTP